MLRGSVGRVVPLNGRWRELGVQGGMKVYTGSPVAARCYLEADRARVDDYYLAEGTGLADRYVATPETLVKAAAMDGDAYERWVAGFDVETGTLRDRRRTDGRAVRFVEVIVNGPKSWSLAAAVHPEIAAAYDAAQRRAAIEIIGWLAQHATTRMGPQNRQVQVAVEELEAAVVAHQTSRAGDPHRHLHLQVNSRVYAVGAWRGLHTVGVRDSLAAINGIGTAAIACDPGFRAALARYGYRLEENSEIAELAPYVGVFSARAAQITRTMDRYEAQWRIEHPGQEPGPRLRQRWHAGAWAEDRPDKITPTDGVKLTRRWVEQLHALGFRPPLLDRRLTATPIGAIDRDQLVDDVLVRLGSARSAWNAADIRGEVERAVAAAGVVAAGPVRVEFTEDLTSRALAKCVPLLARPDAPEHVRNLTSAAVLEVEADLTTRLTNRSQAPVTGGYVWSHNLTGLDPAQRRVAQALVGDYQLLVVEGAAGAGKTATLKAVARSLVGTPAGCLTVVTPTRKAAQVASLELDPAEAITAMQLAYAHGFRKDPDGRWTRVDERPDTYDPGYLWRGSVLLVDEAGMLDQDTARALLTIADEHHLQVVLMGDRHQLPAVGRGGVLDLAARWAPPGAHHTLDTVHRFTDPDYADLTLLMRTGERPDQVFDELVSRGQIVLHPSEVERLHALTDVEGLLVADTREQVAALNAATRDHRLTTGQTDPTRWFTTDAGERIGVGDIVATRRNDRHLDVANRDTWAITAIHADGTLHLRRHSRERHGERHGERSGERHGERTIPAAYAREHVELAYATTVHGAQGETVDQAHLVLGDHTSAASAYVAMTRGRHHNTAHLVAENLDQARQQWVETFTRDRADLGPTHAAHRAADDIDRYGPMVALQAAALRAHRHGMAAPHPDRSPAFTPEVSPSGPSLGIGK